MVRKRRDISQIFGAAAEGAAAISQQDQVAEAKAEERRGQRTLLDMAKIQPRATDTRPLDPKHVTDLVESISALGLIEPLVVDQQFILLAGAHRLAAVKQIGAEQPAAFEQHFESGVPVRVMPFDSTQEPEQALKVELAENEKRQNYTRSQIERLAERLRLLNYRDTPGRPAKGEKALAPAVAVAIGVSSRHVRRILNQEQDEEENKKTRTSCPNFQKRTQVLKRLEKTLGELATLPVDDTYQAIDRLSRELRTEIQTVLAKERGE